jgi:hypothetical protein
MKSRTYGHQEAGQEKNQAILLLFVVVIIVVINGVTSILIGMTVADN